MKLHILFLCVLATFLPACTSSSRYAFVYLKTGPESARRTPEESRAIFAGHMANMQRLAAEKQLLVAGPFAKPTDPAWRGVFILDVPDGAAARALAATDPAVAAGVFVTEIHAFKSSPHLRRTLQFEQEMLAQAPPAQPGSTSAHIRPYVMITAADAPRARAAVLTSPLSKSLVFHGTLTDRGTGVFVFAAESVQEIQDAITAAHIDLGPCTIDAWWSTKSLLRLAPHTPAASPSASVP